MRELRSVLRWKPAYTLPMIALAAILHPNAAHAQEASETPAPFNPDHVIIGLAGVHAPGYQGSDSYRTLVLPMIDVAKGEFFLNLRNGAGVEVVRSKVVTIGISFAPTMGYRRRDAPEGIGNLSFGAGARVSTRLNIGPALIGLGATQGVIGGTGGLVADANIAYPIRVSSRLSVLPAIGVSWADRKHNDRYFGVDAVQSQASGLPEYHLSSGFKDVSGTISGTIFSPNASHSTFPAVCPLC